MPYLIWLRESCLGCSHRVETGLGSASKLPWQSTTVNTRPKRIFPRKQQTSLSSGTEYSAAWASATRK